jgi:hypothetical protein
VAYDQRQPPADDCPQRSLSAHPESSNFWLISLRLWTSQGEVQEEHAFRAGLAEPELLHALDRRIFSEFFRTYAAQVASKGMGSPCRFQRRV